MKLFGSLKELVTLAWRQNSQQIISEPNQATTYTADRTIQLPPGDTNHILVSATSTQTLTAKTIDGDDNTLQDISITSLKTNAGAASTFISRDGAGVVISTKAVPTGTVVGTSDTQVLTGKTIDGDDNTVQDLPVTALKTNAGAANTFISRDGSGVPISTKAVPTGTVVGTTDTQTLSAKTLTSPTVTGTLLLQNPSGAQPVLALSEDPDNGTNLINIQAPASLTADYTLTLPVDDGTSNQVLSTDGSGVLSWATVLSNPMTTPEDIIKATTAGAPVRLAIGAANTVLRSNGSQVLGYALLVNANIDTAAAIAMSKINYDPTVMTDAQASALGRKEYVAADVGVTGNNTFNPGDCFFYPAQMSNGSWVLRFMIGGTSASTTSLTITLANTTFVNLAGTNEGQACSGKTDQNANTRATANDNAGTILITCGTASTTWTVSGYCRLAAKPSWVA